MTSVAEVRIFAYAAYEAGICVLPPRQDGSKAPDADRWTEFQKRRGTAAEMERWYSNGRTGVGFICGEVSGHIELFEFDDLDTYEAFMVAADEAGMGDLVDSIQSGYSEATPGSGIHWFVRVPGESKGGKLAERPKRPEEMTHENDRRKTLIETKGEGGYAIVAPTYGKVHPSGNPYRLIAGGPATIVTLTSEEHSMLRALAQSFDQIERQPPSEPKQAQFPTDGSVRPGDDYTARTTWNDVLEPHGWRPVFQRGDTVHWRRPGAQTRGIDATTNANGSDMLYVFSSSTSFDDHRGYSRFSAYVHLMHNGDVEAAVKQLAAEGYGEAAAPPPGASLALVGGDAPRRKYNRTDYGNAERLVDRHGADLHYCHPLKRWYVWDGRRWAQDANAEVMRRAKETVRAMWSEIGKITDDTERKEMAKWVVASEGSGRLNAMLDVAASELPLPIDIGHLDADPWLLNCANGTIDLRTGELRPHSRADLITKLIPIPYDRAAVLDLWEQFLIDVTDGNVDLIGFLRRAAGYSMAGVTDEEKLLFVQGPGGSGKSTFMEAIRMAAGEYAATADFETFLARNKVTGGPREDIARLVGARLVSSIEVDEGKRLAEGLVKTLTGGDKVTARELYERAFEFLPQFTLWLVANVSPRINDDDAIWRRILRVPFDQALPAERRDPRVKASLRNPAIAGRAVLAWLVRGCLEWQQHGLGVPPVVELATEAYRLDQDPLAGFLADCCILHPDAWVSSSDLRSAYDHWARENGERTLSANLFGPKLRRHGVEEWRTGRERRWRGIGLRTPIGTSSVSETMTDDGSDDGTPELPWWQG